MPIDKQMNNRTPKTRSFIGEIVLAAALLLPLGADAADGKASPAPDAVVAVGPQYDSTHVYVAPADLDAFVKSFAATFGGKGSKRIVGNVLPTPSSAELQSVMSPIGTLSIFAYLFVQL